MSLAWQYYRVPFKFSLSDITLFAPRVWLQVREVGLAENSPSSDASEPPIVPLQPGSQGFLVRSMRAPSELPPVRRIGGYLRYVAAQYPRHYVDLTQSFNSYKAKFSSKTRSTILRKIKRFEDHCGGRIDMRVYRTPSEMDEFFLRARQVSVTTYQERLLDAGLPDTAEFRETLARLASRDEVRGYLLFCRDQPVSYLYCPIDDGVLLYQYLGYDSKYSKWSVGTILQWCAFESIFGEGRFRIFDFTEGQSEHKRLFATGSVRCANVYFLRYTARNWLLVQGQRAASWFSESIGSVLGRFGLKSRVRNWLRFGFEDRRRSTTPESDG